MRYLHSLPVIINLEKSGFIYLIAFNLLIAVIIFFIPLGLTTNDEIFLFFGILCPSLFALALRCPELILVLYTMIGTGYHLRLFPDSSMPFFQYPIWIWLVTIGGVTLFSFVKKIKIDLPDIKNIKIIFIFSLWLILSLLWTENINYGISKSLIFFMDLVLFFLIYFFILNFPERIHDILFYLLLMSAIYALITIAAVFTPEGLNIFGFDKNQFGRVIVSIFPLVALLTRKTGILLSILFGIAIILSGSRTALLVFLCLVILTIINFIKSGGIKKNFHKVTLIFLACSLIFIIITPLIKSFPLFQYQISGLQDFVKVLKGDYQQLESIKNRYVYFFTFSQDLLNPIKYIRGLGIGGYTSVYYRIFGEEADRAYPHCLFAEIYYELGVMGLVLFFILIKKVFRKVKIANSNLEWQFNVRDAIIKMALCITIFSFFSGNIENLRMLLFIYGLTLGYNRYLMKINK